ncbi:putative nucleic acid-binding protein [Inhella inkyongensis]|uniref:Ribonuclease VapC n=1 Tax=Inhella inkyongensis TaxID=392593 RepID=A0A840S8F3_9BURK|nr:type II toxin-antitoxin system VapC family toxin [Inhella inkyongensis]MBB5205074.1 putative nucleic acid-binding protein [Inhella inkyongensis]
MKILLDPSALVKRYLDEPGRAAVQAALAQAHQVAVAAHCRAELVSALAAHREALPEPELQRLLGLLQADFEDFERVALDRRVEALSQALLLRHSRLPASDALHLAAAQACGADRLITADPRQAEAARAEGLATQLIEES